MRLPRHSDPVVNYVFVLMGVILLLGVVVFMLTAHP